MKSLKLFFCLILVGVLFFGSSLGFGESYFYFEPFSATPANGWWYVATGNDGGLWYGRDGTFPTYDTNVREESVNFTGGNLVFDRRVVNSSSANGLGTWVGAVVGFTNKLWNSSPYNPFGFEILRKAAQIDPQDGDPTSSGYGTIGMNPESRRHSASMSIFLAVYSNLNNASPNGTRFPDQVVLYDMMRMCDNVSNDANTTPYSQWGYWTGSYSRLWLTNVQSLAGSTYNIKPILEWNMDDDWVHITNEGKIGWYSQYPNSLSTNTNYIKIMMTHDGSKVQFFVNANPNNLGSGPFSGIPNAMLKIGEVSVAFSSNVFPLMGVETIRYDTERQYVLFDDFYIRTIASAVTSEISPYEVSTNSNFTLNIFIKPIFGSVNDAGVSEIHIKKPDTWTSFDWASYTNQIAIMVYSNNVLLATYSKQSGDVNPSAGNVSLSIKSYSVSGDTLKIRFRATSVADNQIIRPVSISDYTNKFIRIVISNIDPLQVASGEIEVYVDNPKYSDTWTDTAVGSAPRYATTGRMKSYSGNALNVGSIDPSLLDGNTLYISVFGLPKAYGGISPNLVYQGTTNTFYYDISTRNVVNGVYITSVKIVVPPGFVINPNTTVATNISSLLITDPVNNIIVSNEGGTNVIYVDYWREGKFIPASDGIDKITIKTYGTPIDITNVFHDWYAYVNNRYVGGIGNVWVMVDTNSTYPSRKVESRRPRANVEAWITANGTSDWYIENTSVSNTYRYVLKNMGLTGNNILTARIALPSWITNVSSISNSIPANTSVQNISGTNYVVIDYQSMSTNLPAGTNDVITFVGVDSVPPLTNDFTNSLLSFVDNGNGDGFVNVSESTLGWKIRVITPPARGKAYVYEPNEEGGDNPATAYHHVYVDYTEQLVKVYIENVGEVGNDIFRAYIYYPISYITNVYDFYSTKISSSYIYKTNISGSNFIVVDYYGAGTRLYSSSNDTIYFRMNYNVNDYTNITLPVFVANSTNFAKSVSVNLPLDNNLDINFIFSPINVSASVEVSNDYIDRASSTNEVKFYITNNASPKNKVKSLVIQVPSYFSTNVISVSSTYVGNDPLNVYFDPGLNRIVVNYTNGLPGGTNDVISATFVDHINYSTNTVFVASMTNVRIGSGSSTNISLSILVSDPPVSASYGVSNNVILVSTNGEVDNIIVMISNRGTGANEITYARINLPSVLQGKVTNVVGSWTNVSYITFDSTKVEVGYSNTTGNPYKGLEAGNSDMIRIFFTNYNSSVATNNILVQVDNSPDFPPLSNVVTLITGMSSNVYVVDKAKYMLISTNVINVAEDVSTVALRVEAGNGYSIKKVRIYLDYPFVTNSISVSSGYGGSSSIGSNYVDITYSGSGLPSGAFDEITMQVRDIYSEITNYTNYITTYVDYNDGKGFRSAVVNTSGTNMIVFKYTTALAEGYVQPNMVGEDFDSYTYTFYVNNVGLPGNNIVEVTISNSPFITNVSSVTSSILGTSGIDILSNRIVIKYWNANTNIPSSYQDVITVVAYDSISDTSSVGGSTNGSWALMVNNVTNPLSYVSVSVPSGKSLDHIIYKPSYNARVYLEMSNSITSYPYDRHKVYTTSDATNTMYYYLYNYSGNGNNIQKFFITIPSINSIILTNGMTVSSARGGTSYVSNNGEIVVEYSTPIPPGENDVITISFKDNIDDGETNIYWLSEVAFDSTAGKRKPTQLMSGKVNWISFIMPMPSAQSFISLPTVREIYLSDTVFQINFVISNSGVDKNVLRGARIDVPSVFDILSVSNTSGTTNNIVGNSIYVYYTNSLATSNTNTIVITLSNKLSTVSNVSVSGIVWNSKNTNVFNARSFGDNTIKVVSLPSFYTYPNLIDTSYQYTNYYVYLRNDSSGSRAIKRIKIVLPNGFYSVLSNIDSQLVSSDSQYVSNFGQTNVYIYYDLEGKEISVGGQDILTFYGYDNFTVEDTNGSIVAYFDDGSGIWREMKVFEGYSRDVQFVMPPAMAEVSISPDFIYVSESSNVIRLDITNKGVGSNILRRLRFAIPYGFTSFSVISNTLGGIASNYVSGGMMYIWYSNNNGIQAGQMDSIFFDTESMFDVLTNVSFIVNVGNRYDNLWYTTGTMPGGTTMLRVIYPPLLILGYVNKGNYVYTINTNATIEYKIINKSRDVYVTNVILNFDTTNFTITRIESVALSNSAVATVIDTNTPNTIKLSFNPTDFDFNKECVLSIDVVYEITNFYPISMTGIVWVWGATNTNASITKPSGLSQIVYVTNAPFGRIIGYVTPYRYPITVKQVDANGNIIKDSEDNDIIAISSTSNGYFYLPEVYPDANNKVLLSFDSPYYRSKVYEFNAEKNKNNFVGTVVMLNKPFSKSSTEDQDIISPDDNKSKVIVKSGNIQRDFSIDLYITNLTELQKYVIQKDEKIAKPTTYDNMKGYFLDIRGYSYDELIKEIGISGDIVLYLYYPSVISNYYGNEDKIGVYYWKESTGDWIRIGGIVDKQNKFIIAKVSYLHRYYGIFESSQNLEGVIRNVNVSPKMFTPFVKGQTVDPNYGVAKVSFEFDKVYNKYEVSIYNLEGRLIKRIIKEDPEGYINGEIGWDGTDVDGKPVRNGVYIFRIKVEDKVYTGTIILVK